jgi:uncharacterized protein YndB with AHSA1/START domain
MKQLKFSIQINAPKKKVWDTMLQPETYKKWVNVSWPGSYNEGKWATGEKMKFISPGQGGTLASLEEVKPYDNIFARHIAVLNPDLSEDRTSDIAKGWIGITEQYTFKEEAGKTTLTILANTPPAWESMFNDGWPGALKALKELCEN